MAKIKVKKEEASLRSATTWVVRKGVSVDSMAKGRLAEMEQEQRADVEKALAKIVKAIDGQPEGVQVAACLAAASQYTFDVLCKQADSKPIQQQKGKLQKKIETIGSKFAGKIPANLWEQLQAELIAATKRGPRKTAQAD